MSSTPTSGHSPEKYENPLDVIPGVKSIRDYKKFLNTRRAILSGDPLYNFTQGELKSASLMGPWAFNAAQSLVSATPGVVIWEVYSTLHPSAAAGHMVVDSATNLIKQDVATLLSPLVPPFTLLAIVFLVAYASLPEDCLNFKNWFSAQRKYLYFDASYGIWPQMMLAFCTPLLAAMRSEDATPSPLLQIPGPIALGLLVGYFLAFLWQGIVTAARIRRRLFEYDYLGGRPSMFMVFDDPPMAKFYIVTALAIPSVVTTIVLTMDRLAGLIAKIIVR